MITEDYVSFETAKLLKDKGFNEPCNMAYCETNNGYKLKNDVGHTNLMFIAFRIQSGVMNYSAPTLQMAMKWLREVHKIEVRVIYDNDKSSWYGACNPMCEFSQILLGFNCESNSYEEACEAGIRYVLENLI